MDKKRTVFLAGFGVLAVALLLTVAYWPPFQSESASGAIGAVAKHRQQQIASKDVVLGDESTRKSERVVYGDFLADAAKLSNVSAEMAAFLQNFDAEMQAKGAESMRKEIANFAVELQSHAAEVQARYVENATVELQSIEKFVGSRSAEMGAKTLGNLNAELQSIEKQLGAKDLGVKELSNIEAELAAVVKELGKSAVYSRNLGNVEAELQQMAKELQNVAEMASFEAELQNIGAELQMSAELANREIANRQSYLGAMVLESKALQNVHAELASFAEMLGANAAANRTALNAQVAELQNAAETLAAQSIELQNRALQSMEARMEARMVESRTLSNIDAALASIEKGLASRESQLGASALANARKELGNLDAAVASRTAELQNRMIGSMQSELAAIDTQLQNAAEMANRAMGAKLENRALQSRVLANFDAYLQNVAEAMASRASGNRELGARVDELRNRTAELQSRASN